MKYTIGGFFLFSFKELISKLKKAGVPESYIETLETYENYL